MRGALVLGLLAVSACVAEPLLFEAAGAAGAGGDAGGGGGGGARLVLIDAGPACVPFPCLGDSSWPGICDAQLEHAVECHELPERCHWSYNWPVITCADGGQHPIACCPEPLE